MFNGVLNKKRQGLLHTVEAEKGVQDIWRDIKAIMLNRRY
jgi:hypothetical protein